MSVVIETTLGDITVDLFLKERPRSCLNFLKLCKIKYYNYHLFHTVSRGFIAQTGDPTGSRKGGESIFGVVEGPSKRYYEAETNPRIKHSVSGLISFVGNEDGMVGSQFFLTLSEELTYLDGKHCVFGQVVEGMDVLEVINEAICDTDDRPYQDIRITHTVILEDPLPDIKGLSVPSRSPSPSAERLQGGRIAPDEQIDETAGKSMEEISELIAEREAKARATILEMVGDLPDAEMAPPENVLFVCKLNPVTTDDDLEIIFSRFGKIKSCEVIRDHKTGDSLQYAFVEFEEKKSCEDAYFKMDNVLIDDRRIHVDFSQSVSKLKWMGKGRGVKHFDEKGREKTEFKERRQRTRDDSHEKNKPNREERDDNRKTFSEYSREKRYSDLSKSKKQEHFSKDRSIQYNHRNRSRSRSPRRRRSRSRSVSRKNMRSRTPPRKRSRSRSLSRKNRRNSPVRQLKQNTKYYRKSSNERKNEKFSSRDQRQENNTKFKTKSKHDNLSDGDSDLDSDYKKYKSKSKFPTKKKSVSSDSDSEYKKNKSKNKKKKKTHDSTDSSEDEKKLIRKKKKPNYNSTDSNSSTDSESEEETTSKRKKDKSKEKKYVKKSDNSSNYKERSKKIKKKKDRSRKSSESTSDSDYRKKRKTREHSSDSSSDDSDQKHNSKTLIIRRKLEEIEIKQRKLAKKKR